MAADNRTGFNYPPARCPAGHEMRPGQYLMGWHPCEDPRCLPLRGHRTWRCTRCIDDHKETVVYDPPCPKEMESR